MSPKESQQEASPLSADTTSPNHAAPDQAHPKDWNPAALPQPVSTAAETKNENSSLNVANEDPYGDLASLDKTKVQGVEGVEGAKGQQNPPADEVSRLAVKDDGNTHVGDTPLSSQKDATKPAPGKAPEKQPSPGASQEEWDEKQESSLEAAAQNEHFLSEDDGDRPDKDGRRESRPEIQGIMDQFEADSSDFEPQALKKTPTGGSIGGSLPVFQYPPRASSLTNIQAAAADGPASPDTVRSPQAPSISSASATHDPERASLSALPPTVSQPPPPAPDPEPDLPFDFHRFLEQLRHRTADPVAKFLRSFLQEFGKRPWMVHEQQKIISDFLSFIANRMAQCEIWKNVSDAEFDNAREGMEKLVMNRLYTQTFSPEIPPPEPIKTPTRRKPQTPTFGPGRKGQHQEDTERDEVLAQKIRIYGWVKEEHLDLPAFSDKGRKFLTLAQQELSKINSYRAPRDKVICVLNACKVLFGFLRNSSNDTSADSFIPLLIYTVLKAAPSSLVSNMQYILRFRNPDKLNGEAGYYMSSLMGAVQFIENLDRTSLTISDADFETEVEKAVSAIAERHERDEQRRSIDRLRLAADKAGPSRPEVTPRNSGDNRAGPTSEPDENATVVGLLRTIQKPLSTIGRFLTEPEPQSPPASAHGNKPGPVLTPQPAATPVRNSPMPQRTGIMGAIAGSGAIAPAPGAEADLQRQRLAAQDDAARQASAEVAEAHRLQRAEHQTVVE
ncbi:hypothetical protein FH972_022067 [Carpinus fangiana]|uniref:VPS9 domain-containing protein n=1 Tax=Carpinus fangiana TaxID=176857 RepID=A0A5N6KTC6_9ROSI|nr:hypothetical protein FH972_022067 [Carpinus fangiana]